MLTAQKKEGTDVGSIDIAADEETKNSKSPVGKLSLKDPLTLA